MTSRLKLLYRIKRRYALTSQDICLESVRMPFMRIADPDRVLDDAVAQEHRPDRQQPPAVPYWAELWESAWGVAQVIARGLSCNRVLDLGCGMGLTGAVAAAGGAEVLMADLEPCALLLARLNTWNWRQRIRTRRVDWQTDRLGEQFDLIVGADILYDQSQWIFLEEFWRAHLARGGCVLLGEPGRSTGDCFGQWIGNRGWSMEQSSEPVAAINKSVRIFRLRAK